MWWLLINKKDLLRMKGENCLNLKIIFKKWFDKPYINHIISYNSIRKVKSERIRTNTRKKVFRKTHLILHTLKYVFGIQFNERLGSINLFWAVTSFLRYNHLWLLGDIIQWRFVWLKAIIVWFVILILYFAKWSRRQSLCRCTWM